MPRHAQVLAGSKENGWKASCPCGWEGDKTYDSQKEAVAAYKAHKPTPAQRYIGK